jgi:hypothetical protein
MRYDGLGGLRRSRQQTVNRTQRKQEGSHEKLMNIGSEAANETANGGLADLES